MMAKRIVMVVIVWMVSLIVERGTASAKPCLTSTSPPEFSIGLDGAIERYPGHTQLVTALAGLDDDRRAKERLHVRIERFASKNPRAPVPYLECDAAPGTAIDLAKNLDLAKICGGRCAGDLWRVTLMLTHEVTGRLGLKPPLPKTGAHWEHIKEKAIAFETGLVINKLDQLVTALERKEKMAAVQTIIGFPTDKNEYDLKRQALARDYPVAEPAIEQIKDEVPKLRDLAEVVKANPNTDISADPRLVAWKQLVTRSMDTTHGMRFEPSLQHCSEAFQHNALKHAELAPYWPVGVFVLPTAPMDSTLEIPLTGIQQDARRLPDDGPATVWATYVPADAPDIRFQLVAGPQANSNIGAIVAAFIGAFGPVTFAGTKINSLTNPTSPELEANPLLQLTSIDWCHDREEQIQAEVPLIPFAAYQSIATTTTATDPKGLERDRNYTVYVCSGPCIIAGAKPTMLAQGQLTTRPG